MKLAPRNAFFFSVLERTRTTKNKTKAEDYFCFAAFGNHNILAPQSKNKKVKFVSAGLEDSLSLNITCLVGRHTHIQTHEEHLTTRNYQNLRHIHVESSDDASDTDGQHL